MPGTESLNYSVEALIAKFGNRITHEQAIPAIQSARTKKPAGEGGP